MAQNDDGFFKGLVLGAVIAGVAALLLAPKSGEELREDFKRKVKDAKEDTEDKIDELRSGLSRKTEELKSAARDLGDEAKRESEALVDQAERLKHDLKSAAGNLASTGKNARAEVAAEVRPLMTQGSVVLGELERLTRKLANSAKEKFVDGDEES